MRERTAGFDSPDDETNLGYRCLRVRANISVSLVVANRSTCIITSTLGETTHIRGLVHPLPPVFSQNVKANSSKQCESEGRSPFMLGQRKAVRPPVVEGTTPRIGTVGCMSFCDEI